MLAIEMVIAAFRLARAEKSQHKRHLTRAEKSKLKRIILFKQVIKTQFAKTVF
jgi:hypothetical protein